MFLTRRYIIDFLTHVESTQRLGATSPTSSPPGGATTAWNPRDTCAEHRLPLTCFCLDAGDSCSVYLCAVCAEYHQGHTIVSVGDATLETTLDSVSNRIVREQVSAQGTFVRFNNFQHRC